MKRFDNWSIRGKLMGLFIMMAAVTSVAIALPMALFDFLELRRSMTSDLATLADALARNSTAALTFRDARSAQDVLDALRAEPSVTTSCLYLRDGTPLASYVRDGNLANFSAPAPEKPNTRFEPGKLVQFRNVVLEGENLGTIYVESDLRKLDSRLREYSAVLVLVTLVSLLISPLISFRLQSPISEPLAQLVETVQAVLTRNDYSIRAALDRRDEFGLLGSTFNGMLDQIEKRDKELRGHGERLEQEVASRTSELITANDQLRRAEEKYRAIVEDAVVGIFQITPEGRPCSINRALAQMHGYDSPQEFVSEISSVPSQLFVKPEIMQLLRTRLDCDGVVRGEEIEVYRRDRSKKWALVNMRSVHDPSGETVLYEGTVEDITDRKAAEDRVQFLAYYDALTGLPNRTLLRDRFETYLSSARRRNEKVALLFLDLDDFKVINDSLGHTFGDLLLQNVATRLKHWAREQDTVSRIGGDEFLIVLSGITEITDVGVAAERIMAAMRQEFVVQGRTFLISCSIGISVFPEHGTDSETLIKNADAAMYCAKDGGRNEFRFFTEEMNAEVIERMMLESGMRLALDNKELFLVFQPQMNVSSERIVGVEALLRWQHPDLGLVPPDRFIRVAENSGLIIPIGEWVLKTACETVRRWQQDHMIAIPVAVNVSAIQFRQDGFPDLVQRTLRETGLEPQYLEVELTESLLLSNAQMTLQVLQQLKQMGVRISIDDFGTGYSSLSYLRHFPVHKLKIDRSFIRTVTSNSDDAAITSAIINLGKSLNLTVIAEGVETERQLTFLRRHHCDEIQGYYCSKPLTAEEAIQKIRSAESKAHFHAGVT